MSGSVSPLRTHPVRRFLQGIAVVGLRGVIILALLALVPASRVVAARPALERRFGRGRVHKLPQPE
jgi:hypothetical protein